MQFQKGVPTHQFGTGLRAVLSTPDAIETLCRRADLLTATVLVPGATAPKLVSAVDRAGHEARFR